MPFKSKAQRRKFAQLLVEGKITDEQYEEWNRSTGRKELPERVADVKKGTRKRATKMRVAKKRTARKSSPSTTKRAPTTRARKSSARKAR
jgi:hypothetical protein